MGLISKDHDSKMTPALQKKIIDNFALVIINEYDILHNREIEKKDIGPNKYMATRYLQI